MSGEADRTSIEEEVDTGKETAEKNLMKPKDPKVPWAKLRRVDSLNLEAGRVSMVAHDPYQMDWRTTLSLAFQSIGVVYGDIGTSPLYVYASTFTKKINNTDDILGVLSLIIYSIVLIPLLKYVFIVLWANDNGNGGAIALYSLIFRHIKMSLIPNQQPEDRELSNYKLETPSTEFKRAQKLKQKLEGSHVARIVLLLLAIMGTSMVIGEGILTPSISVLSAVSGISTSLGQGSQAMFADLGHFNVRSIQISFSCITCPAIVVAYIGQAAFLRKFPEKVANTFYDSVPGAFSIISQAISLGCFPRVRVVHTSVKHQGQVYIPEVNYMFMIACIVVCAAFKTTEKICHAYGMAVIGDMMITTTLASLIMLVLWKKSRWRVGVFFLGFGFIEIVYFSSQLTKFTAGGYLPIVSAMFLTAVMGIWHYVHKERYMFELKNKVSSAYLNEVANNPDVRRVPGIGLLYELILGHSNILFNH
ncbi:Potassium transporter 5 [Glycine soja]|uniref:Potassium transporter 5 n=1 Tax=Glycine soja TaxID=3848 RepID=A0A0B2Q9B5_GLYSO|nr:Potassium transporter 5 [Glycine soja]